MNPSKDQLTLVKIKLALETGFKGLKITGAEIVEGVMVITFQVQDRPEDAVHLLGHEWRDQGLFEICKLLLAKIEASLSAQSTHNQTVH